MIATHKLAAHAAMLLAVLVLAGCAAKTGGGTSAEPDVWGYVASADSAQLEVDDTQTGTSELTVARVLAPGAAWVVVHTDDGGKPGERVGITHIDEGESLDVRVTLEDVTTDSVIVAVHADRAKQGEFDFDMMEPKTSPDRPYFVNGAELAVVVALQQ